ncbi:MAG: hypothetical protein AAFR96_08325 [Planctomycetota bacterium]
MSTIGAGVAASVAAQAVSERQAVAKKNAAEREKQKLRRELEDRFNPSTAQIEEAAAVVDVEGDEESPADTKDRERQSERQRNAKHDGASAEDQPGHIDIEA